MAKYDVTHSCGHEVTHQIYGKHSGFGGRESKIEWLSGQPCLECKRAAEAAERAKASAVAAEANVSAGLPALTGSDKQIAWAESIRAAAIAKLGGTPEIAHHLSEAAKAELSDALVLIRSEITDQAAAKWWIENRDEDVVSNPARWMRDQLKSRHEALAPTAAAEIAARLAARKPQD